MDGFGTLVSVGLLIGVALLGVLIYLLLCLLFNGVELKRVFE